MSVILVTLVSEFDFFYFLFSLIINHQFERI